MFICSCEELELRWVPGLMYMLDSELVGIGGYRWAKRDNVDETIHDGTAWMRAVSRGASTMLDAT